MSLYNTELKSPPRGCLKDTVETRYKEIWYNKYLIITNYFLFSFGPKWLISFALFIDYWNNKISDTCITHKMSWSQGSHYTEFPLYQLAKSLNQLGWVQLHWLHSKYIQIHSYIPGLESYWPDYNQYDNIAWLWTGLSMLLYNPTTSDCIDRRHTSSLKPSD